MQRVTWTTTTLGEFHADVHDEEVSAMVADLGDLGFDATVSEIDPTPCCPDPGCPGNPCTFPGYAANH